VAVNSICDQILEAVTASRLIKIVTERAICQKTTDFSKFNVMILQKRALISYKRFFKAPSVAKNTVNFKFKKSLILRKLRVLISTSH
jgi:hypothetical protein